MSLELFDALFAELDVDTKVSIFNEWARENRPDDEIFEFDEDFLNVYFETPYDACRAMFFGNITSWNDPYIRFNGYANLVSMSDSETEEYIKDYVSELYEYPECYSSYIDEVDDEEEDDEEEECEEDV
ncbi:MAG: hypothetical protein J6Y37_12095 [Paludibacteraceae bacterium]|nr:hypothetical protein [Paludibacteraceae bacterium]